MSEVGGINVAIIEDDPMLAKQMKLILGNAPYGAKVHYLASTVEAFMDDYIADPTPLDIILLDLDLKGEMSLPHISKIKRLAHPVKVVMVTGYEDEALLAKAIESGADGYFVKRRHPRPSLPEVVHLTHNGGAFLEPQLASSLLRTFQNKKYPNLRVDFLTVAQELQLSFSKREIQVLDGLLEERSYQEIADLNFISINTVRHYVKAIYQKLEVNSKKALIEKLRKIQQL